MSNDEKARSTIISTTDLNEKQQVIKARSTTNLGSASNLGSTPDLNRNNLVPAVAVKTSKLSLLLDTFVQWSSSCDNNCYTKVFEYKSVVARILWLFILCASTFFTFYLIDMSIVNYYNYEVVTQIQVNTDTAMTTIFPAITLCDNNPFTNQEGQDLFFNISLENDIDMFDEPLELTSLMKMAAANPSFGDDNRKKLGLAVSQIFRCKYNGYVNCTNDLQWYYMFEYGTCLQFNVNETNLTRIQTPGEQFGVSFVIDRSNKEM
jgi:hypothetical protein